MPGRKPVSPDTSTFRGRIGEIIRRRRMRKKLSVEDAAAATGKPAQTWYNWERGRVLSIDALPAIAAALECTPRQLLPE